MFDLSLSVAREGTELQVRQNTTESFKNRRKKPRKTKKVPVKRNPTIEHKFRKPHPLLRFVTKKTVAFLFKIEVEQIYRIECWQHVVYVHAEGVSRFVSYADFPPVITADLPVPKDFIYWGKRWVKKSRKRVAPEFWVRFYTEKFKAAKSLEQLRKWGELVVMCQFCFEERNRERLNENYSYQEFLITATAKANKCQ